MSTTILRDCSKNIPYLVADSSVSPQGLKWAVDPVADVITTAGDLIYGSAADTVARLGIGTASQVLAVNSGATAPEWVTPAGGGANWSLVNTGGTSLTGATTITVSGISGADKLLILFNASAANASSNISVRFNSDTGNNYAMYGPQFTYSASYNINNASFWNSQTESSIRIFTIADNAASSGAGYLLLSGGNSSGLKTYLSAGGANAGGGNSPETRTLAGFYNSSSTISSVSIVSSSGNLDSGTVYVYKSA